MLDNLFVTLMAFMFEPMNFIYNIKYMVIGMVCIIIVMGVLILITTALNKLVPKFSKKKDFLAPTYQMRLCIPIAFSPLVPSPRLRLHLACDAATLARSSSRSGRFATGITWSGPHASGVDDGGRL